jgi:toxin ParE1/3/4
MKIRWLASALGDLQEIAQYIAEDNPAAARRTIRTIREAAQHLTQHPEMGRPGRVEGTRELVISGTPYLMAYRVRSRTVEILCVLHGARRWPGQF